MGEALWAVKQFEKAEEHLKAAAALDPRMAQTWNSLGLLATDRSCPAVAEPSFREAIKLNPRVMAVRVNLANALHSLGRVDEAIAELRVVLEAEPHNVRALANLGQMLCEAGHGMLGEADPPLPPGRGARSEPGHGLERPGQGASPPGIV